MTAPKAWTAGAVLPQLTYVPPQVLIYCGHESRTTRYGNQEDWAEACNSISQGATAKPKQPDKPVALTVKVTGQTYLRLCTLRATERRTNQAILLDAVQQYLDKAGA